MAERAWKGRLQRSVEFPDSAVPTHMRRFEFDRRRAVSIKFGPTSWTAVPSVGVLGEGDEKVDVRNVIHSPGTWMLLKRDTLDVVAGLELETEKSSAEDRVDLRVLRSSGRPIAEGTAWLSGNDVEFEVRVLGVRRRGKRGTVLRGVLDSSGRLEMRLGGASA